MTTLSFDPGTNSTGWSLFEDNKLLDAGKFRATSTWNQSKRLGYMLKRSQELISTVIPDVVVVEEQFMGVNRKTSLITARAMGVIIAYSGLLDIKVVGFPPAEVKKAVTNMGNADKYVVSAKINELYKGNPVMSKIGPYVESGKDKTDDIYDAIAINHTYWLLGEIRYEKKKNQVKETSRIL